MKFIEDSHKMYRWLAILFFVGSGAGSIYLFYQVPSLPFLQGINEEALRTTVSLAWVMIIPTWMLLFFAAMALLQIILRKLDLKKWVSYPASNYQPCLFFGYLQQIVRFDKVCLPKIFSRLVAYPIRQAVQSIGSTSKYPIPKNIATVVFPDSYSLKQSFLMALIEICIYSLDGYSM